MRDSWQWRLAHRVCLYSGQDPAEWLDSVTPAALHRWEAFSRVEPFGRDMEQTAMICQTLSELIAMVAATVGVKVRARDIRTVSDFMPQNWAFRESGKPTSGMDVDAMQEKLGKLFSAVEQK